VHCTIVEVDQDVVVYQSGVEFIEPSAHVSSGNQSVHLGD
jgi:hypothetical protein